MARDDETIGWASFRSDKHQTLQGQVGVILQEYSSPLHVFLPLETDLTRDAATLKYQLCSTWQQAGRVLHLGTVTPKRPSFLSADSPPAHTTGYPPTLPTTLPTTLPAGCWLLAVGCGLRA